MYSFATTLNTWKPQTWVSLVVGEWQFFAAVKKKFMSNLPALRCKGVL